MIYIILINKSSVIAMLYNNIAIALDRIEYTKPKVFGIIVI